MLDVGCSPWLLLNSGPRPPAFNMALDEALLEAMPRLGRPVLRFYGWTEPAATFGYFQKYAEVERATHLRPLIRRSTGGGIVPHDADWTYSLAFPPGHEWHSLKAEESYRRVHEWIQAAFAKLNVTTELASAAFPNSKLPPSPSAPARQASIQAASKRSADGRTPNSFFGAGSWPQSPHGWQRQIRLAASAVPANAPRSRTASIAYCEHVGVKRQPPVGPNKNVSTGEITS